MTTYTPTVWQNNDAITAVKLNKIETRIEELQNMQRVWYYDPDEDDSGGEISGPMKSVEEESR